MPLVTLKKSSLVVTGRWLPGMDDQDAYWKNIRDDEDDQDDEPHDKDHERP